MTALKINTVYSEYEYQSKLRSINNVLSVSVDNLSVLRSMLLKYRRQDEYSLSAGYYGFTGRKGLWVYAFDQTFLVFCWHPNVDNMILVFPPLGKNPESLIKRFVYNVPPPQKGFLMARCAPEDSQNLKSLILQGYLSEVQEKVLDWIYPVYILDNRLVVKHKGKGFSQFRQRLNAVNELDLKVSDLDLSVHESEIRELVHNWALEKISSDFSYEDLVGPYNALITMLKAKALPLFGIVIFYKNKLVSFSMWEETQLDRGVANQLVGFSDNLEKGISEYLWFALCKSVLNKGYTSLCIGGSESAGLDRFKRKLNPTHSVSLKSYHLISSSHSYKEAA